MSDKQLKSKNIGQVYGSVSSGNIAYNVSGVQTQGKQQDFLETAKEIQALLEQLIETSPTTTTIEKMTVATKAIQYIEKNPTLKQRIISATKAGYIEFLKQSPIGAILAGAIEGWTLTN